MAHMINATHSTARQTNEILLFAIKEKEKTKMIFLLRTQTDKNQIKPDVDRQKGKN